MSEENFRVILNNNIDNDSIIITSENKATEWIKRALDNYDPKNSSYSTYLSDEKGGYNSVTLDEIEKLADGAQSNLQSILKINRIVKKFINSDDIIGRVVEAITTNINTSSTLSFPNFNSKKKIDLKRLEDVKGLIKGFNKEIHLQNLIVDIVPRTYTEGSYITYLRKTNNGYTITNFPLGVAEISDYYIQTEPVVLINMQKLRSALQKNYPKNKKGKGLFYEKMEDEVKATYPIEVYDAFVNKETYAKLDAKNTGVIRVNELGRKYGLTSIFKALKPTIMLDTFSKADDVNAKSKAKKIIVQRMHKEIMQNQNGECTNNKLDWTALAHENFMSAFQQKTVIATLPPWVEKVEYVEPSVEDVPSDKITLYRNKVLSALGISFLASDKSTSANIANISLTQLMKQIDKIVEQFEIVLNKWYAIILTDLGYSEEFFPEIDIMSSEQMEQDMKIELASFLYNTLGASRETSFNMVGLDIKDEVAKRQRENNDKYDDIFKPYGTSYTKSSATTTNADGTQNKGGAPSTQEDLDRLDTDTTYNETMRVD